MIEYEGCVTNTRQQNEYNSLKVAHSFCKNFVITMAKLTYTDEPELAAKPTNEDELHNWANSKALAAKHDVQKGFFFGLPQRETSFNDSFECALFLAENGHYTQAIVLLRTALNNVLSTAMKQIVQTIPKRAQESEYLREMFGDKIENLDYSQSRSGVGGRYEFTLKYNNISIRKAIRELLDVGFIQEPIVESQFIKKRPGKDDHKWVGNYKLNLIALNGHAHAHDSVVDRSRTEEESHVLTREREFSEVLWKEFQSVAFAILDLKLGIIKSLNKANSNIYMINYLQKNHEANLKVTRHTQFIPNFAVSNAKGWIRNCICCKNRPLSNNKLEGRNYVCGTCKE